MVWPHGGPRTWWLLPAALVIFVLEFVGDGVAGSGQNVRWYLVMVAAIALALAIYWCAVRFLVGRHVHELDSRRAAPLTVAGIIVGLVLFGIILLVLVAARVYSVGSSGLDWHRIIGPAIVASATAGVFEELVMRGALFQLFERLGGSWVALILTSFIFGLLHFANQGAGPWLLVSITLSGGLLFGAAFLYARSLWLPIGLHFAFDTAEKSLGTPGETPGVLSFARHGPDLLTGGNAGLEASIVTVAGCVVLSIALLIGAAARGHLVPLRRRARAAARSAAA